MSHNSFLGPSGILSLWKAVRTMVQERGTDAPRELGVVKVVMTHGTRTVQET